MKTDKFPFSIENQNFYADQTIGGEPGILVCTGFCKKPGPYQGDPVFKHLSEIDNQEDGQTLNIHAAGRKPGDIIIFASPRTEKLRTDWRLTAEELPEMKTGKNYSDQLVFFVYGKEFCGYFAAKTGWFYVCEHGFHAPFAPGREDANIMTSYEGDGPQIPLKWRYLR